MDTVKSTLLMQALKEDDVVYENAIVAGNTYMQDMRNHASHGTVVKNMFLLLRLDLLTVCCKLCKLLASTFKSYTQHDIISLITTITCLLIINNEITIPIPI